MKPGIIAALFTIAIAVLSTYFIYKGETPNVQGISPNMQEITNNVATDMENRYNMAKRNGSKTDIYVAAMMCSAAYLQAHDEPNYIKWKAIEKEEAKNAGMPAE